MSFFHTYIYPLLDLQRFSFLADEKERFDPTQFQESIVQGLNQSGTDLEAVAKFLDASGGKLDYRRYAETLFDILVAGGMLGECTSACFSVGIIYNQCGQVRAVLQKLRCPLRADPPVWVRGYPFPVGPMDNKRKRLLLTTCVFSPAAPGGTLSDDMTRTEFCLFTAQEDLETMQAYAQVANTASNLSSSSSLEPWREDPHHRS